MADLRKGVSSVLFAGVVLSGTLMAAGLLGHGHAWAPLCLSWGIGALIATPVVRVALLAYGYAREGDWKFCAVSLGVLALLLAGTALGVKH